MIALNVLMKKTKSVSHNCDNYAFSSNFKQQRKSCA